MNYNKDLNLVAGMKKMSKMKFSQAISFFLRRYYHAFLFLGYPLIMAHFLILEKFVIPTYWISTYIDQFIPFWPVFVIPYMLWFPIVGIILLLLCFTDRGDFTRTIMLIFSGMIFSLIVFTIFPHGQPLRPVFTDNDAFSQVVKYNIYANDTSTNTCPSLHVLIQMAVHIGLCKSKVCKNRKSWKMISLVMTVLVCASTILIKQHSIIDVVIALIVTVPLYVLTFRINWLEYFSNPMRSRTLAVAKKLKLEGNFSSLEQLAYDM